MYTYRIKVRKKTYLWGGKGVRVPLRSDCLMTFRNDEVGDRISFGKTVEDNGPRDHEFGALEPGEAFTVRLDDICGIYAACAGDGNTNITCVIHNVGGPGKQDEGG